jgi:hypothetical protein
MAFNPFHAFRKHQKVIFAGLTILCMFTFVAMGSSFSGGGDFFSEVQRLFGGRGRAAEVATLYGKNIDNREIVNLREQRRIANVFMHSAIQTAANTMVSSLTDARSRLSEQGKSDIQRVRISILVAFNRGKFPSPLAELVSNLEDNVSSLGYLEQTSSNLQPEKDNIKQLRLLLQRLVQELQQNQDESTPGLYFGGSLSVEGLLDFMIWQHEADRLGIRLTSADVDKAVQHETFGRLTNANINQIEQSIALERRGGTQVLISALAEEFRVRLAQTAVLGFDPQGFSHVPTPVAPYESWQYYVQNRTEVNATLLPVPVRDFLSQVKDKPSEQELIDLYEKYKDEEPAPYKENPGFKLPQRIKVDWISTYAQADYYRNAVKRWLLSVVAATSSSPTLAMALTAPVLKEYERKHESTQWNKEIESAPLTEPDFALSFYTFANFQRPTHPAAVVGALGSIGTGVDPLWSLIGLDAAAAAQESRELAPLIAHEARNRIPFSCALLSTGSSVAPMLSAETIWQHAAKAKQAFPLDLVKNQVLRKVQQDVATDLMSSSLRTFASDLAAKKGNAAQADKFVSEEVRRYGWKHGASKELDDFFSIRNDKGLELLKEAVDRESDLSAQLDPNRAESKGKRFANRLFLQSPSTLYSPAEASGADGEIVLYWRTENQPPRSIPFAQAKPRVEEAWRFEKARALAKNEAEKVAKEAGKNKGDAVRNLTEASKRLGSPLMSLYGVARLKRQLTSRAGKVQYEPYKVPEDKIEYPAGDFVDRMLDIPDTGDVAVLHDQPQAHYYVVTLTQRNKPDSNKPSDVKQFQREMWSPFERSLLTIEERRFQKKYLEQCLADLRSQARLAIENPDTVKELDKAGSAQD